MASLPLRRTDRHHRQPLTGSRLIIVSAAIGFALFLLWAMLAKVDEVSNGQGKVIPSSKAQLIQSAEPATIRELMVRSGQQVRLDSCWPARRNRALELGRSAETRHCRRAQTGFRPKHEPRPHARASATKPNCARSASRRCAPHRGAQREPNAARGREARQSRQIQGSSSLAQRRPPARTAGGRNRAPDRVARCPARSDR